MPTDDETSDKLVTQQAEANKAPDETKPIEEPEAKAEFCQLRCTDQPPPGFNRWGRFVSNSHPHVVGWRLMRR